MVTTYGRAQVRTPDWSRIKRANAPRVSGVIPAPDVPAKNANVILNKQTQTLNRAGSGIGNPILAGLGVRGQISMGLNDRLLGIYLYQDQGIPGANLVSEASVAGQMATFDFMAGSGRTVSGTPSTGPVRNFVRIQTKAGAYEKEFWIKSYDRDIVTLDGQAALDADTLLPVEYQIQIVDVSREWLDVNVDFMPSWNDEFQALSRSAGQQAEAGFQKPYGGALFVSFFDKTPGTEGVGTQVNPITKAQISSQRSIQVENAEGLKEITARFRSEQDSVFYVDVPLKIRVTAAPADNCSAPFSEPCSEVYLKAGTALPAGCPAIASVPGVRVVAGTVGVPLVADLLIVTVHGTGVGADLLLRVGMTKWIADAQALAGAKRDPVGTFEDYLPLVQDGDGPVEAPPYGDPHRLTIAFAVSQLTVDQVESITVGVKDGEHVADPILITASKARAIGFMPIGGTGGGELCPY